MVDGRNIIAVMICLTLTCAGCTGAGISDQQDALEAAQSSLAQVSLPKISMPELGKVPPPVIGSPTEVYTRIARGALTCWFGAHGSLKKTHVYSAVAKPPSKGGQARILVHQRDPSLRDKRGTRAFAIDILPMGDTARLEIQNARMGEPRGTEMTNDARRWAGGLEGCVEEPVAEGWDTDAEGKPSAPAEKKP